MEFTISKKNGDTVTFESTLSLAKSADMVRKSLINSNTYTGFAFDLIQAYESDQTSPKQELWIMKLAADLEQQKDQGPGEFVNLIKTMQKAQSGLKSRAQFRLHGYVLKFVTRGKNEGGVYVYSEDGYSGVINPNGHLYGADDDATAVLAEAAQDVVLAARQFGRDTGTCSMCGHALTDPVSIWAGIGPVCMERLTGGVARKQLHDEYIKHQVDQLAKAF